MDFKQQTTYNPKALVFGDDGREKLISGITKIANAVKSTLGPQGRTVLIESLYHTHGLTSTKDGATVAKSIELLDPVENMAVRVLKQASDKSAQDAGDGTTTAIVLAEAIIKAGNEHITDDDNMTEVLRELSRVVEEEVIPMLVSSSIPLDMDKMVDIATISANNDIELGQLIAEAYRLVGKDGQVTIEHSVAPQTYIDTKEGMRIDRGYSSPGFINNQEREECILEDPFVFVCDGEISSMSQLDPVWEHIVKSKRPLLLVAPCSVPMLNTLSMNVIKYGLKFCAVAPPAMGYRRDELMSDIAFVTGATYFSERTGDSLEHMSVSDLGTAEKVVVGKSDSVLIKDVSAVTADKLGKRVDELKGQRKLLKNKGERDFCGRRIAGLTGGVAQIFVGGGTDLEQKERYDRVEDAVLAVRSALEEGIVPGGGIALFELGEWAALHSSEVVYSILSDALMTPCGQILSNAGIDVDWEDRPAGWGIDSKGNCRVNMVDAGIVDPLKVTRLALQNAVSVARTILSTDCVVTLERTY